MQETPVSILSSGLDFFKVRQMDAKKEHQQRDDQRKAGKITKNHQRQKGDSHHDALITGKRHFGP